MDVDDCMAGENLVYGDWISNDHGFFRKVELGHPRAWICLESVCKGNLVTRLIAVPVYPSHPTPEANGSFRSATADEISEVLRTHGGGDIFARDFSEVPTIGPVLRERVKAMDDAQKPYRGSFSVLVEDILKDHPALKHPEPPPCKTCPYWLPKDRNADEKAECIRLPPKLYPTIVRTTDNAPYVELYPCTYPHQTCGEHPDFPAYVKRAQLKIAMTHHDPIA